MTIPAKNAQIHWSTIDHRNGGRVVDEIWIFDRTLPWEDRDELQCSAGACTSDWLDGTDLRSTPAGLYAQLAFAGFKDDATHIAVLDAFATIEGCEWAAQMATTYRWLMDVDQDEAE